MRFTIAILGVLFSVAAQAIPVTYSFQMPDWSFTDDSSLFGTTGPVVDVTLDNGASSTAFQTYTTSDIVSLSVSTSGSYGTNIWTAADVIENSDPDAIYFLADGSGTGLLRLTSADTSRIVFSNSGGTWQFADGIDPYANIWLEATANFGGGGYAYFDNDSLEVYGSTVSAVPVPAAVWLFGSALAGLGWLRRKQTV